MARGSGVPACRGVARWTVRRARGKVRERERFSLSLSWDRRAQARSWASRDSSEPQCRDVRRRDGKVPSSRWLALAILQWRASSRSSEQQRSPERRSALLAAQRRWQWQQRRSRDRALHRYEWGCRLRMSRRRDSINDDDECNRLGRCHREFVDARVHATPASSATTGGHATRHRRR